MTQQHDYAAALEALEVLSGGHTIKHIHGRAIRHALKVTDRLMQPRRNAAEEVLRDQLLAEVESLDNQHSGKEKP